MEPNLLNMERGSASSYTLQVPEGVKHRSNSQFSDVSQTTEVEAKQNIIFGNPAQAAWGILLDYSRISTVHGVRYMVARKRPWWERILWICIFVAAICICARLIAKIWLKWETTPVIVSFSEKTTPIWEIPFPSVVLCPESRTVNGTFNFTEAFYQVIDNPSRDKFDNISTTDYENLQTLSQICDADLVERLKFKISEPIDVLDTMVSLAPTINYTMPFGMFKHKVFFPDGYFTTVFTDLGVCHQFNGMHQSEILHFPSTTNFTFEGEVYRESTWSVDEGYRTRANDNNTYPWRVETAGARGGLFLSLQGRIQDIDYLCRGSVEGFSIQLLSPDEFPAANKQYVRVPFNKDVQLLITPQYITTSENVKHYSAERRGCFFNEERSLKFFKKYTQNNCVLECLTNYTLTKCGCVKFSMPRTKDMPICQASDILCYQTAEDDLLRDQFEHGLIGYSDSPDCNCLPACTSIVYQVEISEAHFDVYKVLEAYRENYTDENPGLVMGRTSIFFKEQQILTIRRSQLFGTTDFLASSGGLLGLFVGISALSFVEIIYFCTVRLISNLKMRRKVKSVVYQQ
ncbi:unnamed protein product [Hermetia illucens]|uniref:Pickpocket protein 28 n=1 Tax=Hermetia illucens TaxID=343691 RepID=A0A7R8UYZ7_HERIL|nr:pickpocket protein 28-like isoform X2 [Hermetia illucens]CAD7089096.1 unnamed protein product [Hermetia illucens]